MVVPKILQKQTTSLVLYVRANALCFGRLFMLETPSSFPLSRRLASSLLRPPALPPIPVPSCDAFPDAIWRASLCRPAARESRGTNGATAAPTHLSPHSPAGFPPARPPARDTWQYRLSGVWGRGCHIHSNLFATPSCLFLDNFLLSLPFHVRPLLTPFLRLSLPHNLGQGAEGQKLLKRGLGSKKQSVRLE